VENPGFLCSSFVRDSREVLCVSSLRVTSLQEQRPRKRRTECQGSSARDAGVRSGVHTLPGRRETESLLLTQHCRRKNWDAFCTSKPSSSFAVSRSSKHGPDEKMFLLSPPCRGDVDIRSAFCSPASPLSAVPQLSVPQGPHCQQFLTCVFPSVLTVSSPSPVCSPASPLSAVPHLSVPQRPRCQQSLTCLFPSVITVSSPSPVCSPASSLSAVTHLSAPQSPHCQQSLTCLVPSVLTVSSNSPVCSPASPLSAVPSL
jgi:hypothetical protein